jgi:hypothetical protein
MANLSAEPERKVFLNGWNDEHQQRSKKVCESKINAEESDKARRELHSILLRYSAFSVFHRGFNIDFKSFLFEELDPVHESVVDDERSLKNLRQATEEAST